jgi:hypothetical protein
MEEQLLGKLNSIRGVISFNTALLERLHTDEQNDYKAIADLNRCNAKLQDELEEVQIVLNDIGFYNS